ACLAGTFPLRLVGRAALSLLFNTLHLPVLAFQFLGYGYKQVSRKLVIAGAAAVSHSSDKV
ncbi:MAG: hypothetical protein FWC60_10035, partial [Firmicutes bacterium]|nr:hypothetical protein [Bacillota bacterium]